MAQTSGSGEIELLATDGVTWVPLMLASNGVDEAGSVRPKTIEEALVASDSDAPASEWLEAVVQEDWSGGIGAERNGYDAAICLDAWSSPGYVLPSGIATNVTVTASNISASPIVAIAEFGVAGDLYFAQRGTASANTARIMRSPTGTGTGAGALVNVLNLGANEFMRDLLVMRDPSNGTLCLWASSSSSTGASGRMHRSTDGTTWASTAAATFGTWGRNRMRPVFWRDEDGIGDWRIVAVSSNQGHVSYTVPGGDPMTALGWVEGVVTGSTQPDTELVVGGEHVFISARDNLFDLDGLGNSPALTSYSPLQQGNYPVAEYLDGWVYRSYGAGGLDRVNVERTGVKQENPGICTPGYGTKAESGWGSGYVTALASYQGFVVAAVFSPVMNRTGIFLGRDRAIAGVETRNLLEWHGPIAINNEAAIVTRLHVTNPGSFAPQARLWLPTWSTDQVSNPKLAWVAMPTSQGALEDLRMGGTYTFADGAGAGPWQTVCQLIGLSDTVGDKASTKFPYQDTYGSLGLGDPSATTKLTAYKRADPTPASTAWGTGTDITAGPTSTITIAAPTSGNKLQTRLDFFSPSGAASPPKPAILDSIRSTYFRTAPSVDSWVFWVHYGSGTVNLPGADVVNTGRDPQWTTDQLVGLCRGNRTTMRDRRGRRWTVKLRQVLPRDVEQNDSEYGSLIRARVTLAILAGPL